MEDHDANFSSDRNVGFHANPIGGPDIVPLYGQSHVKVAGDIKTVKTHGVFVAALERHCPVCGGADVGVTPLDLPGNDAISWESPDSAPESTLHFNVYQTAMMHTVVLGVSRLLNRPELQNNKVEALIELFRLFMRSEPCADSGIWIGFFRKPRIEKGRINSADWVDVIPAEEAAETTPAADGTPDNPTVRVDVQPIGDDNAVVVTMRDEQTGNSDIDENAADLYDDMEGNKLYSDEEGGDI